MSLFTPRLDHVTEMKSKELHRFYSRLLKMDGTKCTQQEKPLVDDIAQYLVTAEAYLKQHGMGSLLSPTSVRLTMPPCKIKERMEHQALIELAMHASCFMQALKDGNVQSIAYAAFMLGRYAPEQPVAVTKVLASARASWKAKQSPKNQPRVTPTALLAAFRELMDRGYSHGEAKRETADEYGVDGKTVQRALKGTRFAKSPGRISRKGHKLPLSI